MPDATAPVCFELVCFELDPRACGPALDHGTKDKHSTMLRHRFRTASLHQLTACLVLVAFIAGLALPALAQQWTWPWETQTERPQQRRQPVPRTRPDDGAPQARSGVCLDLERQLANLINQGRTGTDPIAEARQAMREQSRRVRQFDARLERSGCWEEFFFQRTLRNTRQCNRLARQRESAMRAYESARDIAESGSQSNRREAQDRLLRALARNRCGSAYAREWNKRSNQSVSNFFFQDEDPYSEQDRNTFQGLPFATYRTLCVRLCDGYYFPISFSTLPNYFGRDADACRNRCAAPTALYYHQNPGGSIDQMVSVSGGEPYKELKTAFSYRKQFKKGCSCKRSEYAENDADSEDPAAGAQTRAEAPKRDALSPVR